MRDLTRRGFQTFVALTYKASGLDIFGMNRWLQGTMSWSPVQRQDWRLGRLGDILEFAWDHVPFYREYWGDHGVQRFRLRAVEELQRYPVLTKDVFRANSRLVRPDNLSSIRHREWHTGGTTGQPVHYLRDLEQWTLAEAFHMWGWSQLGYVFGDPVGVIAGGSIIPEKKTFETRVREWMHRRLFLYGVAMDRTIVREYHARLVSHKAKFLYGYPSALYIFGKHLAEQGLSLPELKGVVTTAEMLQPRYREGIEQTLGCPVFNNLGCNDGGYESYECSRHDGLHYNDLQSILETDSTPAGNGRLLITNLWNRSTPFIRYENGDILELETRPCPCGCGFPMIRTIKGRTADILTFANGRSISGPSICMVFGPMEIDGWQLVQTGPSRLEVRMCSSGEIKEEYKDYARNVFSRYLGDDVEIIVRRVDKLKTTGAGKWKPIWTEMESGDDRPSGDDD